MVGGSRFENFPIQMNLSEFGSTHKSPAPPAHLWKSVGRYMRGEGIWGARRDEPPRKESFRKARKAPLRRASEPFRGCEKGLDPFVGAAAAVS